MSPVRIRWQRKAASTDGNARTDLKSPCENLETTPSAAKAALNFRELRHD